VLTQGLVNSEHVITVVRQPITAALRKVFSAAREVAKFTIGEWATAVGAR
jgi:hypothetical protein